MSHTTLICAGLEALVPKEEMLPPGATTVFPVEVVVEVITTTLPFWTLTSLNQKTKKGIIVLNVVMDPDDQGEFELLLHNGGSKCMYGIQEIP